MAKIIFAVKNGKVSIETMEGKPWQIIMENNQSPKIIRPMGFDEMPNELWRIYRIFKIVRPPDEFIFDCLTLADEYVPKGYTVKAEEYLPLPLKIGVYRAWVLQKKYTSSNSAEELFLYPTGMWVNEEKVENWVQEINAPKCCA